MFEYHPYFETPEGATQIWRYMDFVGFVWLLQNSSLWLSRADYFEDQWEGAYPEPTISALKTDENAPFGGWEGFSKRAARMRKTIFINCWYVNEYESAAMWQLYAGMGNSIAIRTSVRRMSDSLSATTKKIHIGRIKYIDYEKEQIEKDNIFAPYLRKRKSFAHESEMRLVMWAMEGGNDLWSGPGDITDDSDIVKNAPPGHAIEVDLNQMIESVFISPKAKPWFTDVVKDVLTKYNCEKLQVKQSDFDVSPPS